jgi:hypothetical protein
VESGLGTLAHLKENLVRQTSFLQKKPSKSPHHLGLSKGKTFLSKVLYVIQFFQGK